MAVCSKTEFLASPVSHWFFWSRMRPAKDVFILLKVKKMGRVASHIIVSCYFREQYQFPTQHLFVEEIEMPFLYEQHDQFLLTAWPWISVIRSGSSSLWPSLNHVAVSLGAWLPSQAPPFQNVEVMPWLSGAHWALSRVLSASPGSGQEVLLLSESKLLIGFWQQLTSVTGFDSIEEQCVLYPSWQSKGREEKKKESEIIFAWAWHLRS